MERWYKQHQAMIFFIGITASIVTYAYTTFSTKQETAEVKVSIHELKADIKDDIKEVKQDVKILLQRRSR